MKLITVQKAAKTLDTSTRHIYRLLEDGSIVGLKSRGAVRIVEDSLNNYIRDRIIKFQTDNGIFSDCDD